MCIRDRSSINKDSEKPSVENNTTSTKSPVAKAKQKVQEMTTPKESSTASNVIKENPTPPTNVVHKKEEIKSTTSVPTPPKPSIENKPAPKVEAPKPVVEEKPKKVEPEKITTVPHTIFDGLLRKYVSSSGNVNYKGLKSDVSKLDSYLKILEKVKVKDLSGRNEKMAFWINAYNAYTLKLIIKNYPLESITNLDGGKPWDVKWIKLDGRTLSLNNIEPFALL